MRLKGTLGLLAALAVGLSLVPGASAEITVPVGDVTDFAMEGQDVATALGEQADQGAYDIFTTYDEALTTSFMGIGCAVDGCDPTLSDQEALVHATEDAVDRAADLGLQSTLTVMAYGTDGALLLAAAGTEVGVGSAETAQATILLGQSTALTAQAFVNTQADRASVLTQATMASAGAIQQATTQGALQTYHQAVVPTSCVVTSVLGNLVGSVDVAEVCHEAIG